MRWPFIGMCVRPTSGAEVTVRIATVGLGLRRSRTAIPHHNAPVPPGRCRGGKTVAYARMAGSHECANSATYAWSGKSSQRHLPASQTKY